MEDADAPFSAHAVATMNLQAGLGKASVTQVCALFGISREACSAAKARPR